MLRVLSIKITHLLFPLLTHSQGKRWADDNQPGWPGRFSLSIVLSVLKNVPTTPHQLTLHRRKQWRINSAKRKENWKKQLQIFAALALYCNCMLLFPFWQKCRSSLWKCCPGMWPFEWEGGYKDRMSEPCKPASHRCFLSVHSSLLALNAWFIRLKSSWERKVSVKLCSRDQSHKLLKSILGHLLEIKERGEGKAMASQVWRRRDVRVHRSRRKTGQEFSCEEKGNKIKRQL